MPHIEFTGTSCRPRLINPGDPARDRDRPIERTAGQAPYASANARRHIRGTTTYDNTPKDWRAQFRAHLAATRPSALTAQPYQPQEPK